MSLFCLLGAVLFAILGFLKYNGMTAEKFIVAWIKSMILTPKKLTFKPVNLYAELMKFIESNNSKKEKKYLRLNINKIWKKGAKKQIENTK